MTLKDKHLRLVGAQFATREESGKPLQYSCLENPMNSMKSANITSFKINFFGVKLIYNVVFILAIQQSESVIHIHISTLF